MRRAACIAMLMAAASGSQVLRVVKFSSLRFEIGSGIVEPSTRVFRAAREWDEFLKANSASPRGRPSIDFGKQTVAAIFAGQKPSGGYSVQVTRVVDESEPGRPARCVVHYRLESPPPDALAIQVLTYPFAVIRIEKRFEQIEFSPPI